MPEESLKLGCLPSPFDRRTLYLSEFYETPTYPPAVACDWDVPGLPCPMFANDRLGSCVPAAAAHRRICDSNALEATPDVVTDMDVIDLYALSSGFDPDTGRGDNGTNVLDMMKVLSNRDWVGRKLYAYTKLILDSAVDVQRSIGWFGNSLLCLALPAAWRGQKVWDVASGRSGRPGTWGLHCVAACRYDHVNVYVRTWSTIIPLTWRALLYYGTEAWTMLGSDWATKERSPGGLNLGQLHEAITHVRQPEIRNQYSTLA